ncbi:chromatin-binding protein RAD9 [Paracoccidioides brasiliensis Pb18]|uniref:BRCT domain-containing protein n=1 Tax=Paracoccidioides brasiliensis (strain Pb18) TaxID=502780 RepID=A0A0A0HQY7_PARBD|nr:chromatin-binding protein RAD9 [Paracoccidioides brasiliensis Pb18]KGM91619.1 hypothetical protein PADG_12303 [Paracoccidioides brasiliensis Pb18]
MEIPCTEGTDKRHRLIASPVNISPLPGVLYAPGMETQDDSLDLDYLKRAALGLVDETSKLDVSKHIHLRDFRQFNSEQGNATASLSITTNQPLQLDAVNSTLPESPTRKMASTTCGLPSDTQPISESVLETFLNQARSNQGLPKAHERDDDDDDLMTKDETLHEGDTGHLDLLADFAESPIANTESVDEDEQHEDIDMADAVSSPTQYQHFPESQRFIRRTPTVRNRQSPPLEASTMSMLSRNPFSSSHHSGSTVMALSQVFNATQNSSSPFTNGPQQDFSSDMPSPNLPVEPEWTGTTTMVFSPFLPSSAVHPKYLEPLTHYVSMEESQAEREKLARLRSIEENGSSDDEFEKEGSFVRRHVRGKYTEESVRRHFANVTAPFRPNPKARGRRSATVHSSPGQTASRNGHRRAALSTGSDIDVIENNTAGASEEETEQEDEHESSQNRRLPQSQFSSEDDKENIDSGPIHIADTTASAHDALSQVLELDTPAGHRNFIRELPDPANLSQESAKPPPGSPDENEIKTTRKSQILKSVNSQQLSREILKRRRVRPRMANTDIGQSSDRECIPSSPISVLCSQGTISVETHSLRLPAKGPRGRPRKSSERIGQSPPVECIPYSLISSQENNITFPEQNTRVDHDAAVSTHGDQPIADAESHLETIAPEANQGDSSDEQVSAEAEHQKGRTEHPKANDKLLENDLSSGEADTAVKPSSLPSRVFETPTMHNKKPPNEDNQTAPETSPSYHQNPSRSLPKTIPLFNQSYSASLTVDDDQLPVVPQFSRAELGGRLQVPGTFTRGVIDRSILAILSSPSGRQRRSLTEIAADHSPCQSLPDLLPDFGLITAEDREFQLITRDRIPQTRKRSRGNDGKAINLSTPLQMDRTPTPEGPVSVSHPAIQVSKHTNEVPERATPVPVSEPDLQNGIVAIQKNRKAPSKKSANVWEVECSPVKPVKQVGRGRKRRLSQPLELPVARPRLSDQLRHSIAGPIEGNKSNSTTPTPTEAISSSDSPDPIQEQKTTKQSKLEVISPSRNAPYLANRVFAFFNGRPQAYFPATCLGISNSVGPLRYLIRFEDSTKPDEVNADAVKRLELRINDIVKVDLMRVPKIPHTVVGFRKPDETASILKMEKGQVSSKMTDIYGHSLVILRPRDSRNSSRRGSDITVPISSIYFDKVLWSRLENREFSYSEFPLPISSTSTSGLQKLKDHHHSSALSASRTPLHFPTVSGLFSGMAFAVSFKDRDERRIGIEQIITENGGRILKEGFTELFNQPLSNSSFAHDESISTIHITEDNNGGLLSLLPRAETTGFVCLLTDEHSRRVKYMQALALNLPCLAGRWIHDCIAKGRIVDWEPYLLPAGKSTFLNNVTRSRTLASNPAQTARLPETIASRPKLLAGQSVLLVMDRGKTAEQRKPYSFLTCALGPSRIARVHDINAAIKLLVSPERGTRSSSAESGTGWDWIYVGDERAAAAARAQLIRESQSDSPARTPAGRSRGRPPKKRRGGGRPVAGAASAAVHAPAGAAEGGATIGQSEVIINGRSIRILDNEFICQSLILGKLFEP